MTEVALREYIERLMAEADKRYQQRFEAQEKAIYEARSSWRDAIAILAILISVATAFGVWFHKGL